MENTATETIPQKPIAKLQGTEIANLPKDLYIPPDAMQVLLETFEGPLDLLLYLIRKQNLDILNIPIAEVTAQYLNYINVMQSLSIELATDYLVIAAILAEIKSRMLLPKNPELPEDDEIDPRAELVRKLQEYEQIKSAANYLEKLPRQERDTFIAQGFAVGIKISKPLPKTSFKELIDAIIRAETQSNAKLEYCVFREKFSVKERIAYILQQVNHDSLTSLSTFFSKAEGRAGLVVSFIAILELFKNHLIDCVQNKPFETVYIKAKTTASVADTCQT